MLAQSANALTAFRWTCACTLTVQGYGFVGITIPAVRGIGGDYYDFIEKHDAGFVTAVGDVSGKGPSAALLMAALHGAVRAQKLGRGRRYRNQKNDE